MSTKTITKVSEVRRFAARRTWTAENSTAEERIAALGFDPFAGEPPLRCGAVTVTSIDHEAGTITVGSSR